MDDLKSINRARAWELIGQIETIYAQHFGPMTMPFQILPEEPPTIPEAKANARWKLKKAQDIREAYKELRPLVLGVEEFEPAMTPIHRNIGALSSIESDLHIYLKNLEGIPNGDVLGLRFSDRVQVRDLAWLAGALVRSGWLSKKLEHSEMEHLFLDQNGVRHSSRTSFSRYPVNRDPAPEDGFEKDFEDSFELFLKHFPRPIGRKNTKGK